MRRLPQAPTRPESRPGHRLRDGAIVADLVRARLRQGGTVRLRGTGFSMFPLVPPGASVTIGFASLAGLAAGDLIAFESVRGVACHLFEGFEPDGRLRTRGIATGPDRPVDPERFVGRVLSIRMVGIELRTDAWSYGILARVAGLSGPLPGRIAAKIWSLVRTRMRR